MKGRIRRYRRGSFYALLAAALVALAVPVSFAGASRSMVTLQVEKYNFPCSDQGKRVIGSDTFKQTKNTLRVSHKLNGADPGKHYSLWLYDAQNCAMPIAYLGDFKVGDDGHGNRTASADVTGTSGWFFVCDYNADTASYNCDNEAGKP